jgi:hypothetical protein
MYPFAFAAGAIALYFMVAALQRPRPAGILAVILWAAYALYEYYVADGTLCDAKCNIRVDLLVVWPVLGIASYFAASTPGQRSGVRKVLGVIAFIVLALVAAPLVYIALVGFPTETQQGPKSQPKG